MSVSLSSERREVTGRNPTRQCLRNSGKVLLQHQWFSMSSLLVCMSAKSLLSILCCAVTMRWCCISSSRSLALVTSLGRDPLAWSNGQEDLHCLPLGMPCTCGVQHDAIKNNTTPNKTKAIKTSTESSSTISALSMSAQGIFYVPEEPNVNQDVPSLKNVLLSSSKKNVCSRDLRIVELPAGWSKLETRRQCSGRSYMCSLIKSL